MQQSQSQTATLAQPTSPVVQQQGSQLIAQSQPQQLSTRQQISSAVVKGTELGKKLAEKGARLHDMAETASEFEVRGVKPVAKLGEMAEAIAESPVEGALYTAVTGRSAEAIGTLNTGLSYSSTAVQACKTVHSLHQAYSSYGTDEFSGHASEALKQSYVTLGGKPTLEVCSSVSEFCKDRSVDKAKEVVKAMAELSSDDSLASNLTRTAISTASSACLGSTATEFAASVTPGLSFGVAAMDTGLMLKCGYDYYNGNASGRDLLRSTITAVGSGTGATVAPVVGPLAASALNATIDVTVDHIAPMIATGATLAYSTVSSGLSTGYNFIKSWW